jgi:hypothetical protein
MNIRNIVLVFLLLAPCLAAAQPAPPATSLRSIGAGPFEFPISGTFTIEREGGASIFTTDDGARHYTVSYFRNITDSGSSSKVDQVAKLATVMRANWERFASQEKGEIVQPFRRIESFSGVSVFSMATEFEVKGERQYYVQFVATDGPRFATFFAEGVGQARPVMQELTPLVLKVSVADGD